MAVKSVSLTSEEAYLVALIQDESGIDLAEFLWEDPLADNAENLFRCWDFQYAWWRDTATLQIDQCSRSVGKTTGIIVRGWAFGIQHPGAEMVVTAPELVHLQPLVSRIEDRIKGSRLTRELLPKRMGMGFKHRPFQVDFNSGAKILGRIPQKDGKGIKGCVVEGTLVLTERGHVPIEEVVPGDLLATHTGAWKPVIRVEVDTNDCFEVVGSQSNPLRVSCDHSFLGARNEAGPKQARRFSQVSWFDVEDLDSMYWASPTRFDALPIPQPVFRGTAQQFEMDEDFWWLTGRYLADGFVSRDERSGKSRKVSWCAVPDECIEIEKRLTSLGFDPRRIQRSHSSADVVEVASAPWERWLVEHFGHRSFNKKIPGFVLGMEDQYRRAVLDGYLSGDGHWASAKRRWQLSSASRALASGMQLLGQSLGYSAIAGSIVPTSQFTDDPLRAWKVYLTDHGHPALVDGYRLAKVKSVTPIGKQRVYNPIVEDDHSYISDVIVSHNLHPLKLEMDEAQDYPAAGWIELIETLRHGQDHAQWRAHGVSRGVHDEFYRRSQPGSGWKVHRITGMHRPTWSDVERKSKIVDYGSRDSPDYKRNILGLHGDATNPLFVLHRLMATVDDVEDSEYNTDIYYYRRISDEMIGASPIEMFVDYPHSHKQWTTTWAGMDVGLTSHPSEILVFGEESVKGRNETTLRLLTRLHLERIRAADQRAIVALLFQFYNLRRFTIDKTGLGLPLFQDIQDELPKYRDRVQGYTADQKVVIGWEDYEEFDDPTDYEIKRVAKEHGYDLLRTYVDQKRLVLPFDTELLGEWQGQTYSREKSETNPYGRKSFSRGKFHTLDAGAMAVLGKELKILETMTMMREQPEVVTPVLV